MANWRIALRIGSPACREGKVDGGGLCRMVNMSIAAFEFYFGEFEFVG